MKDMWEKVERSLLGNKVAPFEMDRYRSLFLEDEFQQLLAEESTSKNQDFFYQEGNQIQFNLKVAGEGRSGTRDLALLPLVDLIHILETDLQSLSREELDSLSIDQFAKLPQPLLNAIAERIEKTYTEGFNDSIWFVLTHIIQTGFPHRQLKGPQHYTRKNGNLTITLSAPDDLKLPSGVAARVLFIHICTEIIRHKKKIIDFGHSLRSFMLNTLGVSATSGPRGSIKAYEKTLVSLMSTSFTFHSLTTENNRVRLDLENVRLSCRSQLWWDQDYNGTNGFFEISNEFYEAVIKHSSPVNREAILYLSAKKSPMAIDIYCWLTYRYWKMTKETRGMIPIKWSDLYLQFGAGYKDKRDFIVNFKAALQNVSEIYPQARFLENKDNDYLWLIRSAPHVSPAEIDL